MYYYVQRKTGEYVVEMYDFDAKEKRDLYAGTAKSIWGLSICDNGNLSLFVDEELIVIPTYY